MEQPITLKKEQVYNYLKDEIVSGRLGHGDKLPRETELSQQLAVSTVTLRAALKRLAEEGYICRIHGRGTFVSMPRETNTAAATIMIIHSPDSSFESSWHYLVPPIVRLAGRYGIKTFEITHTAFELFAAEDIEKFVLKNNIIGIIAAINNFNGSEPIITKLQAAKRPVVLASSRVHDSSITGFAAVAVDEQRAWKDAVKHLTTLGHRRIAVIGKADAMLPFRGAGLKGTVDLLTAGGAEKLPQLVSQSEFNAEAIGQTVEMLVNQHPRPTAILCYSDFYAIYVYEKLKVMNLTIPDDMAVMGICGFPDAGFLNPPLATVDYGYSEIAGKAVDMIRNPHDCFDTVTGQGKMYLQPLTLRPRASAGAVKQTSKNITSRFDSAVPAAVCA